MAQSHETHAAPTPDPYATVDEAARMVLEGLNMVRPRLAHGYGCPAEHAGPCTCGYTELVTGAEELVAALKALPPPELARKH